LYFNFWQPDQIITPIESFHKYFAHFNTDYVETVFTQILLVNFRNNASNSVLNMKF